MDSILIIDDEPQIRKLLSRMMELEGYEVFQAADCQSTLKQLKLHNPQVVLCDVFLPDGNGVDLCRELKGRYHIPILFLTALGEWSGYGYNHQKTLSRIGGDTFDRPR